jgi:hypothetical protein
MDDTKALVRNLIGTRDISSMTAEDIVGNISLNLYEEQNSRIREEVFDSLPNLIKDIILIIDLDTELSMDGILGFLENSTGLFLEDTIQALERISAFADSKILKRIQTILRQHGTSTKRLREDVNAGALYEIASFSKTHGNTYDAMACEIAKEAENLYLYQIDRDIFSYLFQYTDQNKNALLPYLEESEL